MRSRTIAVLCATVVLGLAMGVVPAGAGHDEDLHSDNFKRLGGEIVKIGGDGPAA